MDFVPPKLNQGPRSPSALSHFSLDFLLRQHPALSSSSSSHTHTDAPPQHLFRITTPPTHHHSTSSLSRTSVWLRTSHHHHSDDLLFIGNAPPPDFSLSASLSLGSNSPFLSYPSTVLGRERAIVIDLDQEVLLLTLCYSFPYSEFPLRFSLMDNITIFGHVDRDVEKAVQILRDKNIGVVIRNEQDLNLIRLREDKTLRASKGKENANSSTKGKGKANEDAMCQAAPNFNVKSNFTLAQLARRQRDRNDEGNVRQLAQRKRRDRERLGECIQPRQVRRRHMDKEPNHIEVIAPNQAMVAPIFASLGAIIIPVDNSIGETRRYPEGKEGCSILRLGRRKRQREDSSTQCIEPNEYRSRRLQLMDQETDEADFNQNIQVSPMLPNSLLSSPLSPLIIEDHMSTDPALANQVVLPTTSLAPDNIR